MTARERYEATLREYQDAMRRPDLASVALDLQRLSERLAVEAQAVADEDAEAKRVQLRDTWTNWVSKAAPHVSGRWTARVFEEGGMPEPQRIEATCEHCKTAWKGTCTSGRVREQLQRFAQVHLHIDPITRKPV